MTNWIWAAASQCGTAHGKTGDHRQDAFRVLTADAGFLIAVASDGAGSAICGRYGAAITARLMSTRARDWIAAHSTLPTSAAVDLWIAETQLAIFTAADRIGCSMNDFAATLVMTISNGGSTMTVHIGDGMIVARCAANAILVAMSWPESGEFASTTYFITDPVPRVRIGIVDGITIDRLAVSTDGLERLALDLTRRVVHAPFFDRMFCAVANRTIRGRNRHLSAQLAAFLNSDAVNARTDDDKTLILMAIR